MENLRKLIAEIEAGIPEGVEEKIENCWKELWEKKIDSRFSHEILEENQKLLTEITIAVEAFQSKYIEIDRIRKALKRVSQE